MYIASVKATTTVRRLSLNSSNAATQSMSESFWKSSTRTNTQTMEFSVFSHSILKQYYSLLHTTNTSFAILIRCNFLSSFFLFVPIFVCVSSTACSAFIIGRSRQWMHFYDHIKLQFKQCRGIFFLFFFCRSFVKNELLSAFVRTLHTQTARTSNPMRNSSWKCILNNARTST